MSRTHPPFTSPASTTIFTPAMSPVVYPHRSKNGAEGEDHAHFTPPKLRLEIRDLSHPGAKAYLTAVNTADCLTTAVQNVLQWLYTSPSCKTTHVPPCRSVTLIVRDMPGVAYTTGSELDNDHKEIHLSQQYVQQIKEDRLTDEVTGVLTHELVHCLQYSGKGTCPGGLIEGIADWVRLGCKLAPPHWKRESNGKWDAGYQTTAYFLEYLEGRFGKGTVQRLNEKLRTQRYEEKPFWTELVGRPVEQLWKDYSEKLKDDEAVLVNKEDVSGDENMIKSQDK